MIDISLERPISFNQAQDLVSDGRRISDSTWHRWASKGLKGIKLETVLCGAHRCTTRPAVIRFFSAVTAAVDGESAPAIPSVRQREAEIRTADCKLRAAGI